MTKRLRKDIPTITEKTALKILAEISCPLRGLKGGAEANVEKIQKFIVTLPSKRKAVRYEIHLHGFGAISHLKDWRAIAGSNQGFHNFMVGKL